ncbi:uncharacterized protein N7459_008439 [Penicillium hispanicum]|uniref:uncharacterized protein n=1 Tax=Penicillium hispanicum TaxID=1080232 RepID=UPI002541CEDA|nr:uncharacterized protein N7459_008439 [Penicillium hispanicum]KAJ5574012.1 hypothetical protein N7459_008439 [Penicillium hispanicum]
MVNTSITGNPLDPNAIQQQQSVGDSNNYPATSETHKLNDLDMIIDRNVAPSPQSMCAELAHQHALEDLHNITEHTSELSDASKNTTFARKSSIDRGTQYELRKPDE